MYAGTHARDRADQPCIVMARTGEFITFADYDARTNRLAHLLRAHGLEPGDHYAILVENNCATSSCAEPVRGLASTTRRSTRT